MRLAWLLLTLAVLQLALPSVYLFGAARPNILLTGLLCSALLLPPSHAAVVGFGCGLIEASWSATTVGSLLLTRTVSAWIVGLLDQRLYRDSVALAVVTAGVGTLAAETMLFVFAPRTGAALFLKTLLGTAALNAVCAVPVFWLVRRTARHRDEQRVLSLREG
jgi:rod shape-determining protein MreD